MIPDLPPLDLAGRVDRVRPVLAASGLGSLVVSDLTNVRWLTGFTGSAGRVVVTANRITLVVDGRYGEQARAQSEAAGVAAEVCIGLSGVELLAHVHRLTTGTGRIGFEADHVTIAEHERLVAALGQHPVALTGVVEGARRAKDDGEIARIAAAADIAGRALATVLPLLDEGRTERDLARILDRTMEDLGADGPSFETILASGPNAGRPHARPGDRVVGAGDSVVFDFGALVDGYHSDMTRTILLGDPDPWLRDAYAAVEAAQAAGVAAVRAGRGAAEIDAVCRDLLDTAGFGDHFTHGTGHGVGLLIHESPWSRQGSTDVLLDRDVVTVEPGVYRGDLGGVRIEDTVVVTTDGCRPLTHTPKDLSCLRSPPTTSRPG